MYESLGCGRWNIFPQITHGRDHVSIEGEVEGSSTGEVELYFNDFHLAKALVDRGKFRFYICNAYQSLPEGSFFSVFVNGERVCFYDGSKELVVSKESFLCGQGERLLDIEGKIKSGFLLTKKGTFFDPLDEEKKDRWLELYFDLNEWFLDRGLGPLFVTHGTLLGAARSGDFIPGDDDFDSFYFDGNASCASSAADRRYSLMREMKQSRWKVRVGATGHIKVHRGKEHIDLMPAWAESGFFNIGGYTAMKYCDQDFDIEEESFFLSLRGQKVFALRKYESFLEYQYGDGWIHPDPTWRYKPDERVRNNLKKLRPTVEEVVEFGGSTIKRKYGVL